MTIYVQFMDGDNSIEIRRMDWDMLPRQGDKIQHPTGEYTVRSLTWIVKDRSMAQPNLVSIIASKVIGWENIPSSYKFYEVRLVSNENEK
jgi:hypothetical protein